MNAAKHRLYGINDFSLLINYCIQPFGIIYVLFIFSGPTKNKYHHIILRSTPMLAFCSVIKLFISFVFFLSFICRKHTECAPGECFELNRRTTSVRLKFQHQLHLMTTSFSIIKWKIYLFFSENLFYLLL